MPAQTINPELQKDLKLLKVILTFKYPPFYYFSFYSVVSNMACTIYIYNIVIYVILLNLIS